MNTIIKRGSIEDKREIIDKYPHRMLFAIESEWIGEV